MRKMLLLLTCLIVLYSTSIAQYCNSSFSNASFEHITNVTFGGVNNSSTGNTGGPVNYLNKVAYVYYNNSHNLSVSILADASEYVYAFIDWNQDGDFADSDETYTVASNVSTTGPFVLSIATPLTALAGNTRMRVMVDYNGSTPDPCKNSTYGEAEDYTVNVGNMPACMPPTNLAANPVGISTASVSWDASVSNPTGGYQFELRT
ncbi:MAG TPA: GEVED domain-containing protein, partial [Chitinophagaceae bacterium]|nr:GEVED domain-containing protein [Chitinophagaceae bacterium]